LKAKEYFVNSCYKDTKREEEKEISLKELAIGLPCFLLPVGGISVSYLLDCSFKGKIILTLCGFLAAAIVSCFITWRLKKKGKII
jgi:hypothetical protein